MPLKNRPIGPYLLASMNSFKVSISSFSGFVRMLSSKTRYLCGKSKNKQKLMLLSTLIDVGAYAILIGMFLMCSAKICQRHQLSAQNAGRQNHSET